ncbi:peptidase inhibitor family I36 protein [Streptomyces triculaminicus]|uniref:Peptidase inhibitor family I36 protein n=1 Tax=Streptomyces triculaminicus TaxID=2816232 RepID=A0A939FU26_9ACTN|nr:MULTISPECIES: peptidase inhibitor family I36 protein [Streptomyces]MBO0656824.1 peptidase inhibitor family I36 protein [Streptomyces triculaminicus]
MRTRISTVAVTVTAVAAALLVSVPGASAKPGGAGGTRGARGTGGACSAGQLCLWPKTEFRGQRQVSELAGIEIESCVALPGGVTAASLVNRTGRPVTTYQSATCGETGEFDTYPSGSWVPESPYVVRAYKVWER